MDIITIIKHKKERENRSFFVQTIANKYIQVYNYINNSCGKRKEKTMKKVISILALLLAFVMTFASCSVPTLCKHDDPEQIVTVPGREATCQKAGITDGTKCTKCGTMVVAQTFTEKVECKESSWIIDKYPTETEDGMRHTECVYCGKRMNEEIIEAGSMPDDPNPPECLYHTDINGDYLCDICGAELRNPVKPVEHTYELGMGVHVDLGSADNGTVTGTFAAVVLDEQGKIVLCSVDATYNRVSVSGGGEFTFTNLLTKKEMGDDYGMGRLHIDYDGNGIALEWYEQAKAFEQYVIGKTVEEIRNMPLQYIHNSYISADDALLNAGCSIQITEFRDAVVKACEDEQGMTFITSNEILLGIAAMSANNGSRVDEEGVEIKTYTDLAATVVGADGKILASVNDAFEVALTFDYDGIFTSAKFNGTKREMKDNYGCGGFGIDANGDGINLEWYIQSATFSKHVVGMTKDEVAAMKTVSSNIGGQMSADEELLNAGCTIDITGIRNVVVKSITNTGASFVPDDKPEPPVEKVDVVIWVSDLDGVSELTREQINEFIKENPEYSKYNVIIRLANVSETATQVIMDVAAAPDMYCFAQDQLMRLVQAGALSVLDDTGAAFVRNNNDAGSILASSVNGKVYAYPITSDNGYYMYYDTSIITNPDSLEQIIADVEAYNASHPNDPRYIRFNLENAWYMSSFFFATGCHSYWLLDNNGIFTGVNDNFNSEAGLIAMKGMQNLAQSSCYDNDNDIFSNAAVIVTGIWNAYIAEEHFGENLGVTDLPSFTVDGQSYHLGSYSGNKLMGIKPQSDPEKEEFLHDLANYLSGEECQLERYNEFMWLPSNLSAQNSEAVKSNIHISALAKQNQYAVPQGLIHGAWWDIARALGMDARTSTSESELIKSLECYDSAIQFLLKPSCTGGRLYWSVIGGIMGTAWDCDYNMYEVSDGVWESDVLTFEYGDEFKLRYGASWGTQIGAEGEIKWNGSTNEPANILSIVEGEYIIRLEWDGKSETATVTFVPAE